MLRKAFCWKTETCDPRKSAKTDAASVGEEQLGKLGENEDEEEEPATKRRRD